MKKIAFLILLTMVFALGRTKYPVQSGRAFEIKRHNINNIEMCVSNFGKFGQDETGNAAGMWWPVNSGENYIYGAGSWFGTIVDGDTLVTIGYGPSGGQAEYVPGMAGWPVSDPDAIIFMYPTDWPPTAATLPMAPQEIKSHQDSWCVYNDLDEQYHMPGDTRPIGLEVYQTVYAWNLSATADIIFVQYEIKNVSGSALTDCWFGVATDNDIGNEAGQGNDICSAIVGQYYEIDGEDEWIDNLGYQWQNVEEAGWATFPGVIGFDYLQSPYDLVEGEDKDNDGIPDQYEMDSAYYWNNLPPEMWDVDQDGTPDWRDPSEIPQLGMQSFMRFTLDLEPGRDNERYVCMAGYNYITGVYVQYDTVIPDPDDQRFMQCSGPFELDADSSVMVLVGIMCAARSGPDEAPDSVIVQVDAMAQMIYDQNWLLPGPPAPPILTCIPGDAQITIVWDSNAETYADPYYDVVGLDSSKVPIVPYNEALYDSFYVKYDFQGYGIWKSLNSQDWTLLERCDLYDDVVFDDSAATEIYANNTGLVHYYVDTDVRNGFGYYYAITAFDYNWVTDLDTLGNEYGRPLWFESGKVGVIVSPRRDPANYQPGACSIEVLTGNPILADSSVAVVITYPMKMTDAPFYLEFVPVVYDSATYGGMYAAYLKDANEVAVDSVKVVMGNQDVTIEHSFSERRGIAVAPLFISDLIEGASIFEEITRESGTYPDSLLTPSLPGAWASFFAYWAYRGNNYEVQWYSTTGGTNANSVVVIDLYAGDTIPYSPYDPEASHAYDEHANGWCFQSHLDVSDTLVLNGSPWTTRNTKFLYINGGLVGMNKGGPMTTTNVVPSTNDVWIVHANPDFAPASVNALFRINSTPAYYDATTQIAELNVKVTPNPYLIHNEWQQTFNPRRLKFINLPAECTIRIFNLNGELVRTITHVSTLEPGIGEQEVLGSAGGDEWWDLLTDNRQLISSGVYIFHIQSDVGEQVGKFVVIR
ncbi:hypothetical protein KAX97_09035 [candidate division WOR-3 bacterium]|nr:hypothetical protein [candidate division WOR-3 bacterium]